VSLLWPQSEAKIVADGPALHALIIGAGDYPHLPGGSGPLARDDLGLSQVTTPPVTAKKIAEWFTGSYKNPACPLGSVEVLLSPAQKVGQKKIDRASMTNIEKSFDKWDKRCGSSKENVAVFYFCGHGLNKVAQFLLPDDFGDPALPDEWENCIDFDGMRLGMRACKAQTQVYFVDACRETMFGALTHVGVQGKRLKSAHISDKVATSAAYFATTQGNQAFGPPGEVTYFGQALLKCLNGAGTAISNGKWLVDTYKLSEALGKVMEHLGKLSGEFLIADPQPGGLKAVLHESQEPCVITYVTADKTATIELSSGTDVRMRPADQDTPLVEEVPPGMWQLKVTSPNGEFAPFQEPAFLSPPYFDRSVSLP